MPEDIVESMNGKPLRHIGSGMMQMHEKRVPRPIDTDELVESREKSLVAPDPSGRAQSRPNLQSGGSTLVWFGITEPGTLSADRGIAYRQAGAKHRRGAAHHRRGHD